jgi:hypothetical protein
VLDGLDQIDWSNLHHAFGSAADVPGLLRAVAGTDRIASEGALSELFGTVWHQGTVYEASAYAVPFLARIARQAPLSQSDRSMIVALLGGIAGGWSYIEVHRRSLPEAFGAMDEVNRAREMSHVAAARAAVGREAPALFADLGNQDDRTDWRLSALAAQVSEFALSASPIVERLKGQTDNPSLRAALDLTSAMIAGVATSNVVSAAAAALGPQELALANERTSLSPERRARIVADCLYEDGFDEAQVGG